MLLLRERNYILLDWIFFLKSFPMMYVVASRKNSFVMITSVVIKIFFKNTFLDIFSFFQTVFYCRRCKLFTKQKEKRVQFENNRYCFLL